MAHPRSEILEWTEQGHVAPENLRRALEAGGALPGARDWRLFLDRTLLYIGAVLLAAAVVFFFAYNWRDLGRLAKFALVELPLVAALALVWRVGLERAAGKAALLAAALLVGASLALAGQVYQTGADPYELFAVWAAAILPWALLARFPALWMIWLVLVNLAVTLYFQAFRGLLGIAFGPERQMWTLLALNTVALAAWEGAVAAGVEWLNERWATRVIAGASCALVTLLAVMALVAWQGSGWNVLAWAVWLAAAFIVYRFVNKDVYVLACGALSTIVVATVFLVKSMRIDGAGALLLIGLLVIGMSAAAGWWLRTVAAMEDA
jgi:uncharacterized membrane protein